MNKQYSDLTVEEKNAVTVRRLKAENLNRLNKVQGIRVSLYVDFFSRISETIPLEIMFSTLCVRCPHNETTHGQCFGSGFVGTVGRLDLDPDPE